jgi:D-alanyl-D-alanine carboxypeptidase
MAQQKAQRRNNLLRWTGPTLSPLARLIAQVSLAALLSFGALVSPACAQIGSARYSSIVVDASSGDVLEAANPDALRHPASLTKLMTLYMTFEALRDRRITPNQLVPVSAWAASMEPTKLGLLPATRITVNEAILGLVTKSANDAACALGELLGGSEDRFAQMMTLRARALGMSQTTFTNASGLPDPNQWTTARDLAILARRLVADFPGYYRYFSTPSFVFQHRVIFNHDNMLRSYPGADGMKTGYTDASGHNLVTSAVHSGVRLIGVVLGAASNGERDLHMATLLNQGFDEMDVPVDHHPTVTARVGGLIGVAHAATIETMPHLVAVQPHAASVTWAIQTGSFATERAAREAAQVGRRAADAGVIHTESATVHHRLTWRAQVVGLTAADAQAACSALTHHRHPCMVIRPISGQVASR